MASHVLGPPSFVSNVRRPTVKSSEGPWMAETKWLNSILAWCVFFLNLSPVSSFQSSPVQSSIVIVDGTSNTHLMWYMK